jgi:hypothetical protein
MEFSESVALLVRRKFFFAAAALLALFITVGVAFAVKPVYQAQTELLLLPPKAPAGGGQTVGNNPWNNFGSLDTVAAIIGDVEGSEAAKKRLNAEGVTGSYTVTPDPSGNVPVLTATASSFSPADALRQDKTLSLDVMSYVRNAQVNSGGAQDTFITTQILAAPIKASKDDKSRIRVVLAVAVVAFFLSIAATVMYDSIVDRKRAKPVPAKGIFEAGGHRLDEPRVDTAATSWTRPKRAVGRTQQRSSARNR